MKTKKKPELTTNLIIKKFIGKKKRFKGWKVHHGLIWKPERHRCKISQEEDFKHHFENPPYWFGIEENEVIGFSTIHSPYNEAVRIKLADPEFFEKLEKLLIERA